ncbi:arsenic resistance N-acetyltransferase ArsN2 [Emticicia sp. W12TSBA100-4]|uniref:arsenic resistance N-acetyltransferase ArsN2 n=1 Tax=Emticicia sp. W12TSBA100-4 TaxID=3160965 RepID=UPI0033067CCF
MTIEFGKTPPEKLSEVMALLTLANLPVNDIGENVELFALETNEQIIATAGLEINGLIGLLRSVSVLDSQKGKGFGLLIVSNLEKYAKNQGIKELYLLTTTAKEFFEKKLNYKVIERTDAPTEIQNSKQFTSVCPSSAVIMKKVIQS